MSAVLEQILKSPRLRFYFDEIGETLRREQIARQKFREEMNEDTRAEFINGEVVVHSPCRFGHNKVAQDAFRLLDAYVRSHELGFVAHEKCLVELTRNDVEPDVCFWNVEKSSKFSKEQLLFPTPDLVVEVLSESTASNDRGTKFEDYATHGVGEYWIIDTDREIVEQYVLDGTEYELRLKGTDGTIRLSVIGGAEFPIRALFDDSENKRVTRAFL